MAIQQEHRTSPPSSRARGALRPGSYQVGESVGRVSAVLSDGEHTDSEPSSSASPQVDLGGATAIGQRSVNEDQFRATQVSLAGAKAGTDTESLGALGSQAWFLAVADGMGGQPGALASRLAVEVFAERVCSQFPLTKRGSLSPLALQAFADDAVSACQSALVSEIERMGGGSLPGTTLTAGVVVWPHLYLFHVGDSRSYLLRGLEVQQLTQDHTVYAEIIRTGSPAEGSLPLNEQHPRASSAAKVDTSVVKLRKGDVLMLCTDGITGPLTQEALHAVLATSSTQPAQQVAHSLVDNALSYGGTDNATAVVMKF